MSFPREKWKNDSFQTQDVGGAFATTHALYVGIPHSLKLPSQGKPGLLSNHGLVGIAHHLTAHYTTTNMPQMLTLQ